MDILSKVPENAAEMYQAMIQVSKEPGNTDIFSQKQIMEIIGATSMKEIGESIQQLMNNQMIQAVQSDKEILFQVVSLDSASRKARMGQDELMVFNCIEHAGREGVWTKSIKDKTKLHQTVIQRCLKSLEGQKEIKAIKSVKHPTRKIYMLFNLQPSVEVTGGPWFTDSEMDSEFINSLLMVVWKFICSESFPSAFEETHKIQDSYPSNFTGYPTVKKIHRFVMTSGVVNDGTDLGEADIRKLCEVLVYDDKLERRDAGFSYKATWHSIVEAGGGPGEPTEEYDPYTEAPCGQCPKFSLCETEGPVNPPECLYYDEWLTDQQQEQEHQQNGE